MDHINPNFDLPITEMLGTTYHPKSLYVQKARLQSNISTANFAVFKQILTTKRIYGDPQKHVFKLVRPYIN